MEEKQIPTVYDPASVEKKWYGFWEENNLEKLDEIRKQYSDMGYKGKDLNHAVQFERKEFIEKHICSYAAENSNEFFACLYAEYMDSPEPREAAIVFGEILERIMGEIK